MIQKDLFRCNSSEHFYLVFHLDVESLVTYPNSQKAELLNDDLLLTCMVHIMPKNCNFESCITYLSKVYSKLSYAFQDIRSTECTCARKSNVFVLRTI